MMTSTFDTTNVLGVPYAELDYDQATEQIADWALQRESHYVVVAPVSSLMMARTRPEVADAFEHASLIAADGMPIVWARRLLGRRAASRLYGPDLTLHVMAACAAQGLPIALVGGRPERLDGLCGEVRRRFPAIEIAHAYSPPFRALTDADIREMAADLNVSGARVVFVATGSPKQELLMRRLAPHIQAVQLGVGAAFDFIPGYVAQAPAMLQRLGLEWAFRLACEPRRLFRRYATTIPPFLLHAGWQIAGHQCRRAMRLEGSQA